MDQIKKALEEQLEILSKEQERYIKSCETPSLNVVSKIVEVSRLLLDLERTAACLKKELTK
jgi:hypothetical protein